MGTSISSSSGGFVARIKRAVSELKGRDGSRTSLYVDGSGRLHVKDSQIPDVIDALGNKGQVDIVGPLPAGSNVIGKVQDDFGGATYENQDTATADTARRFETSAKKLRDVLIHVATYAQYFGDSGNQRMEVGADDYMWITKIDISTLYFKNKTASENGVVTILAVEE